MSSNPPNQNLPPNCIPLFRLPDGSIGYPIDQPYPYVGIPIPQYGSLQDRMLDMRSFQASGLDNVNNGIAEPVNSAQCQLQLHQNAARDLSQNLREQGQGLIHMADNLDNRRMGIGLIYEAGRACTNLGKGARDRWDIEEGEGGCLFQQVLIHGTCGFGQPASPGTPLAANT